MEIQPITGKTQTLARRASVICKSRQIETLSYTESCWGTRDISTGPASGKRFPRIPEFNTDVIPLSLQNSKVWGDHGQSGLLHRDLCPPKLLTCPVQPSLQPKQKAILAVKVHVQLTTFGPNNSKQDRNWSASCSLTASEQIHPRNTNYLSLTSLPDAKSQLLFVCSPSTITAEW